MDIAAIQKKLRKFTQDRDWEQYHTPKNLSMALAVEAAELVEIFQWMTTEESIATKDSNDHSQRVGEEVADIMNYVLRLTDVMGIDLEKVVLDKICKNANKYPAAGSATPRSTKCT